VDAKSSDAPRPLKIRLDRPAKLLVIEWSDGLVFRYPWSHLRANCPSAGETVGRQEAAVQANPLAILPKVPSAEVQELRLIGSYALSFSWADGHSAGIYTWENLRRLGEFPVVERSEIASDSP
jgi:DUF971 family protein